MYAIRRFFIEKICFTVRMYLVALTMLAYNLGFRGTSQERHGRDRCRAQNILLQAVLDLAALTLLVYFSDLPRNPFLFFFIFHVIIASMYLRGKAPVVLAAAVACVVGGIILLEYLQWIPRFPVHFPTDPIDPAGPLHPPPLDGG